MRKRATFIFPIVLLCAILISVHESFEFSGHNTIKAVPERHPDAEKQKLYYEKDTTYIVFTFDDGCISDYELAYPLFKRLGIKATSYIIAERPDTNQKDSMDWDMIREMYAYGWDFGCHSYAHSDEKKLSKEQIIDSMEKENTSFIQNGLPAPISHAFPFGSYDTHVIEAIRPYRTLMRKAYYDDIIKKPNELNPCELDSVSADFRGKKRLEQRMKLVDKAVRENDVLIFRTHCLYKNVPDDMGKYVVQTNFQLFEKLVEYVCAQPHTRIVTMAELAKMIQNGVAP